MIPTLKDRLAHLAARNQTTTYGQLARDLGLTGPATIARLTTALETLMEEDARLGRPFRAALLTARGSTIPAPGFFQKAAELGRFTDQDRTEFTLAERASAYLLYGHL